MTGITVKQFTKGLTAALNKASTGNLTAEQKKAIQAYVSDPANGVVFKPVEGSTGKDDAGLEIGKVAKAHPAYGEPT